MTGGIAWRTGVGGMREGGCAGWWWWRGGVESDGSGVDCDWGACVPTDLSAVRPRRAKRPTDGALEPVP